MGKDAAKIYEQKKDVYKRFPEQKHCIYRSLYDPSFQHYHKTLRTGMKDKVDSEKPGYSRRDLALAAASWTINKHMPFAYAHDPPHSPQDYIPEGVKNRKPDRVRKKDLTAYVKKAGEFFGASKVGITKLNKDWIYSTKVQYSTAVSEKDDSTKFPEQKIDDDIDTAIVFIIEMDKDGFRAAPTFLEFAAAGWGYSQMSVIIASMAQFIRNLGYKAIPCANDTALSVPLAIDAGLGALGRLGILITKEFGPRVRICKILTNMPLKSDEPDTKFIKQVDMVCEGCTQCADACEYGAISREGKRDYDTKSISNNPGQKKWYVDVEKCYNGWVEYCSDCGLCITACPFSRMDRFKDPGDFWGY